MDAETQEIRQARQRASVKWLLSKAFNNRVPDNLKEPFYRDHENQERLKPQIIVELGNATLYCQTLSNLYSDPNYQSLNHWSILQTLSRKGVPVAETADMPITETVLIQTNPLRINAHMSVIESLMILYAKEICSGDRIQNAIRRISGSNYQVPTTTATSTSSGSGGGGGGAGGHQTPSTAAYEQALLSWISHACAALKKRIVKEIEMGGTDENGVRLQTPDIPPVRDFQDLCDGICLALLISFYCPKVLPWTAVRINYLPAVEDSIHNVLLVGSFSQKHLPYDIFHMTTEDVTYMRGSMKLNLVVLLTDLFNLFEIHPAKCVCYPGMESSDVIAKRNAAANEHGIVHRRGLTMQTVTPIPDLRSELEDYNHPSSSCSPTNRPPFQVTHSASTSSVLRKSFAAPSDYQINESKNYETNYNEAFVVHKSRGITTLSSMHSHQQHQQQQQQQQQQHQLLQQQQPHHHHQHQSQQHHANQQQQPEPLVPARLRQSKEKTNMESKDDERGEFIAAGRPSNWEQNRRPSYAGRRSRRNSSSEDSQLTIENFGGSQDQLNTIGRYERDREKDRERKLSNTSIVEPAVAIRSSIQDARGTLQLGYDTDSGSEKQDRETEKFSMGRQESMDNVSVVSSNAHINNLSSRNNAGSPSMAQHQQQRHKHSIDKDFVGGVGSDSKPGSVYDFEMSSASTPVRKISHGSQMQAPLPLQQHQQAPTSMQQWPNNYEDNYDDDPRSLDTTNKLMSIRMKLEEKSRLIEQEKRRMEVDLLRYQEKLCQEDIEKWETLSNGSKRTPEIDPSDLEKYQQSIAMMNSNLQDIQQDIQRLATQQNQIQAQQMQAQQLLQAQHIANMLNQQAYGSQQHLPDHYPHSQHHRSSLHQQSFGSTPHLPQAFNAYGNSRPPSRDAYHQQQPMAPPTQYINEHGQYVQSQAQPQPQPPQQPMHYMQPQSMYNDSYNNGGGDYNRYGPLATPPQYVVNRSGGGYDDYSSPSPHLIHQRDPNSPQSNHFFMQQQQHDSTPPMPQPQSNRRTWSQSVFEQQQQQQQQQQQPLVDINAWQSQKKMSGQQQPSFVLHQNGGGNGGGEFQHLFQVHSSPQHAPQRMSGGVGGFMGNGVQRQHSLTNLRDNRSVFDTMKPPQTAPSGGAPATMVPTSAAPPPDEMMAPQSICFIGDEEDVDELERNIIEQMQGTHISSAYNLHLQQQQPISTQHHHQNSGRGSSSEDYDSNEMLSSHKVANITSGNLTYRIPSPTRPSLKSNSFQDPREDKAIEKGFYISFDDEQPKRPKPPLRAKRSPKNDKGLDSVDHQYNVNQQQQQTLKRESLSQMHNMSGGVSGGDNNKDYHQNAENNNKATYNKYTDVPPNHLRQMVVNVAENGDTNRSMEHLHQQQQQQNNQYHVDEMNKPQSPTLIATAAARQQHSSDEAKSKALVIGTDISSLDPESVDEMERRKEKILLLSMQRRQQQEEAKARKEIEAQQKREREREKEEERARKKEEQMARRTAILEQHRLKKAMEEAEREGKTLERSDSVLLGKSQSHSTSTPRLRQQRNTRPRPKTIHVDDASVDISEASSISSSRGKKGSSTNLTGYGLLSSNSMRRDLYRGSQDSLTVKESPDEIPSTSSTPIGRRGSYKTSKEPSSGIGGGGGHIERGRTLSRISVAKGSSLNFRGRKSNSLMNLCDSGLGRATPPRRAPSPGMASNSSMTVGRHMASPGSVSGSGPGSLPPGLISKRRGYDDGSSDISSTPNSLMEYSGPKLYKQPAAKSNRGIILNAVEYCVFPGAVNRDAKQKVLEKIARSEAKHFLILFRDAGCQFRALYSYVPELEQVTKLYGTGPSQVDEVMFDKFFKYNSGGKCFSQVHTKHLTVTIDAFTIHNSLWQGKKVNLPSKKDMALVI